MLVAMVPFMTMAQKRSKKGTNPKTEKKDKSSNENPSFMIIKGVEYWDRMEVAQTDPRDIGLEKDGDDYARLKADDMSLEKLMKQHLKPMSKFSFSFDVGKSTEESLDLNKSSKGFRSMAEAVNQAAVYGWEFINSTIVVDGNITIHYYYMKR